MCPQAPSVTMYSGFSGEQFKRMVLYGVNGSGIVGGYNTSGDQEYRLMDDLGRNKETDALRVPPQ